MKKHIFSLVLVSILMVGVFAACTTEDDNLPEEYASTTEAVVTPPDTITNAPRVPSTYRPVGRGLTVAHNIETPSVTPARHTSLAGHWKNVMTHNGLFRMDYNMNPVPDLVAQWRPLSDTLFEFTLHEGIMFHNGDEMTAEDVVASFHFVRSFPEGAAMHTTVVNAEIVDRYTFTLDTGVPNAMMISSLADQRNFIFPKSLIESGHDFTENPIGSGPFVFEEWNLGDSLTFSRFDNYFDTERSARVEYVTWRVIPEGSTRTIALETGEVDYLVSVAFPDLLRLEANPNITVVEFPSLTYNYMLFNHTRPQFTSVYVRQAIDMALDKESMIVAAFDGRALPIWEMFPAAFAGVSQDNIRRFDPEGAIALLTEQGIDPATLDFEVLLTTEEQRRMAEVAQSNLTDIGIAVSINTIDNAAWLSQTASGLHEAAFGTFTADSILMFIRSTLHSSTIGAQNRSQFYSPEFTWRIDQAVATVDDATRIAMLYDMTAWANEQALWIPICMNYTIRAFNSNLRSPEISAFGFMHFNMVYWME